MNKVTIVFINGHAGVGKDTFVGFCKAYAKESNLCKVVNLHRSDIPKILLRTLGWDGKKDIESRTLLKLMVDYAEKTGVLNEYLDQLVQKSLGLNEDSIIFYHVREPKAMYSLMDRYLGRTDIKILSLFVDRELDEPKEPEDWWKDIETAEYIMKVQLPKDSLYISKAAAEKFVDFILTQDWKIEKKEEE